MFKKIALVAPLLLLAACGDKPPEPKLVTVEKAEVIDTDARECIRFCTWHITVKKGDTTVKLKTSELVAKSATKGSKINFTYDPEALEVKRIMFTDFDPKEEQK